MQSHPRPSKEVAEAIVQRITDRRTVEQFRQRYPQITHQECRGTGGDKELARVVQFALNHLPGGQS